MFNDKIARQLARHQRPVKMDEIDEIAERQGNARNFFSRNEVQPKNLGRRISKESRKASGYAKTADYLATKRLVKDTAEVAKGIIIPQYNLRQI